MKIRLPLQVRVYLAKWLQRRDMIALKEACLWGWVMKDDNINLKWTTSIWLLNVRAGSCRAATTTPLHEELRPRNGI